MTARRINATSNLSSPRCSSTQKPFKIAYSWPQNIGEFSWKLRRMDHNSRIIMTRQTEQTELGRRMKEEIGGGVCVGRGGVGGGNQMTALRFQRWGNIHSWHHFGVGSFNRKGDQIVTVLCKLTPTYLGVTLMVHIHSWHYFARSEIPNCAQEECCSFTTGTVVWLAMANMFLSFHTCVAAMCLNIIRN